MVAFPEGKAIGWDQWLPSLAGSRRVGTGSTGPSSLWSVLLSFLAGWQQYSLLWDHGRIPLRSLPQHLQQQRAAEGHGVHAKEGPWCEQVWDCQVRREAVRVLGVVLASHPVASSAIQKWKVLLLHLDSASYVPTVHVSQLSAGKGGVWQEGKGLGALRKTLVCAPCWETKRCWV